MLEGIRQPVLEAQNKPQVQTSAGMGGVYREGFAEMVRSIHQLPVPCHGQPGLVVGFG